MLLIWAGPCSECERAFSASQVTLALLRPAACSHDALCSLQLVRSVGTPADLEEAGTPGQTVARPAEPRRPLSPAWTPACRMYSCDST